MSSDRRFSVAQIGARMHYAVPRILAEASLLERLFTDISINHGVASIVSKLPGLDKLTFIRRLRARNTEGVPRELVTAFELLGVKYAHKLQRATSERAKLVANLWVADEFSKSIGKIGFGAANAIYGFNSASVGIFSHPSANGVFKILEQTIAPKKIEVSILRQAATIAGECNEDCEPELSEFIDREEEEWALADIILCASDFVHKSLVDCGVSPNKCIVVPYGVDVTSFYPRAPQIQERLPSNNPVRILFIGSIGTRKGIWPLLNAMRELQSVPIVCRVIGPISADKVALEKACPNNVQIVGPVPRSDILAELHWADVFCLPSLCEGSATVIYEALATGLPVVTTENSGSIVRHGKEGLIVRAGDTGDLSLALLRIAVDTDMRNAMALQALDRSQFGSLSAYATRLIDTLLMKPTIERERLHAYRFAS